MEVSDAQRVWSVFIEQITFVDRTFGFPYGAWLPLPDHDFKLEGGAELSLSSQLTAKLRQGDVIARLEAPASLFTTAQLGASPRESIALPIGVQFKVTVLEGQSITLHPNGDTVLKAGATIIWPSSYQSECRHLNHEVRTRTGRTLFWLPEGGTRSPATVPSPYGLYKASTRQRVANERKIFNLSHTK